MTKYHRSTAAALTLALTLTLAPAGLAAPGAESIDQRLDVATRIERTLKAVHKLLKIRIQNDLPAPPKP